MRQKIQDKITTKLENQIQITLYNKEKATLKPIEQELELELSNEEKFSKDPNFLQQLAQNGLFDMLLEIFFKNPEALVEFIKNQEDGQKGILYYAARNDAFEFISNILKKLKQSLNDDEYKEIINRKDPFGSNLLHIATRYC